MSDYDHFLKLEEDFNLFELTVGGVKIWELIRFQVFNSITRRSTSKKKRPTSQLSLLSRLKRLLFSVFLVSRNPFFAPRADILFICSARRLREDDGLWWDIYTDPIMSASRNSYIAFESHFMNEHYQPAKTSNLRYLDFIDFISFILRSIGVVKTSFSKEELQTIRNVQKKVSTIFEFSMDLEKLVRRTLEERRIRLPISKLLLRKIRPNVVVLAQGHMDETMIEASKSLGIPTIELQHGVIIPESVAYSFTGSGRKKTTFADYLFVFGDFWKTSADFPIPNNHVISAGYPNFERLRMKYHGVVKKKQILFISQEPIGYALSQVAAELSSIPDLGYTILYKLHPQEIENWRMKYPWLVSSNLTVIDQKEDILYKLFAESTIQVGVYSTALYEGLGFALTTYILDVPESIYSKSLYEGGLARKFSSASELVELIRKDHLSNQIDIDYIFKSNATENIVSSIDKLVKKMRPSKS